MSNKVKLLACALSLLSFGSIQAQTSHSYYYRGQKIDLTVDKNHVHIIAEEEFLQSARANQLFDKFHLVEQDSPKVPKDPSVSGDPTVLTVPPVPSLTKLKFQSEPSLSDYTRIVDSLTQNPKVKKVFPFFENGDEPIGTSDIFYIKLKTIEDTTLLKTIAQQQNIQIIKQVPYMPLWSILSLQNSAFNNSLEATNFFYETGYFDAVDPAHSELKN